MVTDPRGLADHKNRRAALLPHAYGKPCPRCLEPMLRGQDLDLGHSVDLAVDPTAVGDRIEHTSCNRSAGSEDAKHRRRFAPSRAW